MSNARSEEPCGSNSRAGAVQLKRGQTLRVRGRRGQHGMRQSTAAVWITEENRPRDIVLEPGSCYRLRERGVAVIDALGETSVSFA